MNNLRKFFKPQHEFAFTVEMPPHECAGLLEKYDEKDMLSGIFRMYVRVDVSTKCVESYSIYETTMRARHARGPHTWLKATMESVDTGKTRISGTVKPDMRNKIIISCAGVLFSFVAMLYAIEFWVLILAIGAEYLTTIWQAHYQTHELVNHMKDIFAQQYKHI